MRLLVARHGQTAWNATGRYQGQTDIPLDDTGRRQARALAGHLSDEPIRAIYASDLRRAHETAEIVAERHDCSVQADPRLREISFGRWEGRTHQEIEDHESQALAAWHDDPMNARPPRGETLAQVVSRVAPVLAELTSRHSGQIALIVGHGAALRLLVCLALGLEPPIYWRFRLDLGSLSQIEVADQGSILSYLNDVHFLP